MMVMVKVVATKEMIKCFTFRKEEREKQKWLQGKGIIRDFALHTRHHRGFEWLRIDIYTIKRGNLWLNGLSSATRWHDSSICIYQPSVLTLTLVKCFKNANTRAHKFYTLCLASWKQGQSGFGLRKRKGEESSRLDADRGVTGLTPGASGHL